MRPPPPPPPTSGTNSGSPPPARPDAIPQEAARAGTASPPPSIATVAPTPAEAALFADADADRDGRVAGAEAKTFFERTGLAPATLASVWDAAVAAGGPADPPGPGLGPAAFAAALRLAAIAQAGGLVEAGAAATRTAGPPPALAPPPTAAPSPRAAVLTRAPTVADPASSLSRLRSSSSSAAAAALGDLEGGGAGTLVDDAWAAAPVAAAAPAAAAVAPPLPPPAPLPPPPPLSRSTLRHASTIASGRMDGALSRDLVALDVRCTPLRPKEAARLACLAAGGGSLWAGPAWGGGALQWGLGGRDASPAAPTGAPWSACPATGEDADAAPAAEVPPPGRTSGGGSGSSGPGRPATTAALYERGLAGRQGALWLGFEDGRVARYALPGPGAYVGGTPPPAWLAHRGVAVTALVLTGRGELWTGSARGAIRVWRPNNDNHSSSSSSSSAPWPPAGAGLDGPLGGGPPGASPGVGVGVGGSTAFTPASSGGLSASTTTPDRDRPRELRRLGGARPHGSGVLALAAPSPGSVIWSVGGGRSVCLWCARTGAWLGVLESGALPPPLPTAPPPLAPGAQGAASSSAAATAAPFSAPPSDAVGAWDYDDWGDASAAAVPDRRANGSIDPGTGLEADPGSGAPLLVPPPADRGRLEADQRAWAAGADTRSAELLGSVAAAGGKAVESAGKAARLLGRLGARVVRGLQGAGGGAGGGGGGGGGWEPESASAPLRSLGEEDDAGAAALAAAGVAAINVSDGGPGAAVAAGGGGPASAATAPAPSGGARCLAALPDGTVLVGHKGGRLEAFTHLGRRLWGLELRRGLASLAAVIIAGPSGSSIRAWAGLADGGLAVIDPPCPPSTTPTLLFSWRAHPGGVTAALAAEAHSRRVFSLGSDGTLRAWSAASPSPADTDAQASLAAALPRLTVVESVSLLALTWNVGQARPPPGSPFWGALADLASGADLAVACLQEIEMGGSSVALAAAREAVLPSSNERGNATAQWWAAALQAALGGPGAWARVGLRQLSGMLVLVYARVHLAPAVGDVRTAAVPTGVLGVGGNKGGVAVSCSVHRRRLAAVCSHLAAHQGAVRARNANWAAIARGLAFDGKAWYEAGGGEEGGGGGGGSAPSGRRGSATAAAAPPAPSRGRWEDSSSSDDDGPLSSDEWGGGGTHNPASPKPEEGPGLAACHAVVWGGDFNYRVDLPYEAAVAGAASGDLSSLLAADQLGRARAAGAAFVGFREHPITFRPTYKFDKGAPSPVAYDSSEKRRVPAWTDRILFRGSADGEEDGGGGGGDVHGDRPGALPRPAAAVSASGYGCLPDVVDSDHKPVWAALAVDLAVAPPAAARGAAAAALVVATPSSPPSPPSATLTPASLALSRSAPASAATLTNAGRAPLSWQVVVGSGGEDDEEEAGPALPDWLDLSPTGGLLAPGASVTLVAEAALPEDVFYAHTKPRRAGCVVVGSALGGGGEWSGRLEVALDG